MSISILPKHLVGGGVPVGAARGVQGFVSSTNYLASAVSNPLTGSASGFYAAMAIHILSVPAVDSYPLFCAGASTNGWLLYCPASALMQMMVRDGAGASVVSPTSAIAAGDVGETLHFVGVYDSTGALVRLYRAGVQVGSGTAVVGYTPAPGTARTGLGSNVPGTQACPWARIVGALYGTGIPDAAAILAHYNACKAENDMALMPTVTNVNRWRASTNQPNAATWVDDISGMVLTKTGTLSTVTFTPTWE